MSLSRNQILMLSLVALLAGCASGPVDKPDNRIVAEVAQREIPADQLMNVNVVEFDPNVPAVADQDKDLPVVPAVRQAEASYLAYSLRTTLEGTGQWGAVRVVPERSEEHTSEPQSLMRISYAVFCLKKKKSN